MSAFERCPKCGRLNTVGPWRCPCKQDDGPVHGDSCVDCRNGVTEWHRSRTDKHNRVRPHD